MLWLRGPTFPTTESFQLLAAVLHLTAAAFAHWIPPLSGRMVGRNAFNSDCRNLNQQTVVVRFLSADWS